MVIPYGAPLHPLDSNSPPNQQHSATSLCIPHEKAMGDNALKSLVITTSMEMIGWLPNRGGILLNKGEFRPEISTPRKPQCFWLFFETVQTYPECFKYSRRFDGFLLVELASKNRFFLSHLDSLRGPEVSDEHKQQKEKLPADDKHKGDSVKIDRHEQVW